MIIIQIVYQTSKRRWATWVSASHQDGISILFCFADMADFNARAKDISRNNKEHK